MTKSTKRDLLQYPVETDDIAIICSYGPNHGRVVKVLNRWDGGSIMSVSYDNLKGKDCFVVMSLGSPFAVDEYEPIVWGGIPMKKAHIIPVPTEKLKRVMHFSSVDWKWWK